MGNPSLNPDRPTHSAGRLKTGAASGEHRIKNLIFDLGGVILDISPRRAVEAFARLARQEPAWIEERIGRSLHFSVLERGELSDAEFYEALRDLFSVTAADGELEACWNAMLLDFPIARIRLLERLQKEFRLFLLSNTNAIHARCFSRLLLEATGYSSLDRLFEKTYYSHLIGLRKPMPGIYHHILQSDDSIKAHETLFLDDTLSNLEAAREFGIQTHHVRQADLEHALACCGIAVSP